jgi:hypothetical protein
MVWLCNEFYCPADYWANHTFISFPDFEKHFLKILFQLTFTEFAQQNFDNSNSIKLEVWRLSLVISDQF